MKIERLFSVRGKVAGPWQSTRRPSRGKLATKSRFLLASLSVALLLQVVSANAAPLVLNCESSTDNSSRQFRIDFDKKSVQEIDVPSEKNPPGRAEISESSIKWKTIKVELDAAGGAHEWRVVGSINRLAGSIHWEESNPENPMQLRVLSGKCRPAAQKF